MIAWRSICVIDVCIAIVVCVCVCVCVLATIRDLFGEMHSRINKGNYVDLLTAVL